jgi:hypothetical protein
MRRRGAAAIGVLALLACSAAWCGEADDLEARVVPLERPEQPLDTPAPPARFVEQNGQALWQKAWKRATTPSRDGGGGFIRWSELVGEEFRAAKGFWAEKFNDSELGGQLQFTLAADEAAKDGNKLKLTQMRLVYFRSLKGKPGAADKPGGHEKAKPAVDAPKGGKAARKAQEPAAGKDKRGAPQGAGLPMECQVVLTAPEAVIDLATNEGCATGQVRIEIYAKTLAVVPGKEREPIAVLCTERLLWRTWNEPQTGSTELALYTSSARAGGEDPLVTTTYVMPQNDGTVATMTMEGRGLVYEFGSYDRPTPQEDEDGRTVGLNQTAHNRAIFHRDIKLVTTAAAMAALMPFQGPDGPPPPNAQALGNAKAPVPQTPSQTVLLCSGPAVLNMAAVPRAEATKIRPRGKSAPAQGGVATAAATQGEAGAKQGEASVGDSLEPILLARRFEFYNKVHVIKTPLTAQGTVAPLQAGRTEMSCENLCMQYAAGAVPGPATFPEYAEALGAVSMQGVSAPAPVPGVPPPVPAPYSISCQRVFYDGLNDNTFLVGSADAPAQVKDEKGEAFAQQFCYRRRTQTLTMPAAGPKRMVIQAAALERPAAGGADKEKEPPPPKDKPESPFNLGAGQTTITWHGPLSREVRHLPVPGKPDRIKEVLLLKDNVLIEQPAGGLKMRGQTIRVTRNVPAGDVEFLEGRGNVDVSLGELQARGETVSVEMAYTPAGETAKDLTTVVGNPEK